MARIRTVVKTERHYPDGEIVTVHRFVVETNDGVEHGILDCTLLPAGTRTMDLDVYLLYAQRVVLAQFPMAEFVWIPGSPKLLYLSDADRAMVEMLVSEFRVETMHGVV